MSKMMTVADLMQHYHDQKVIDLDIPLRQLLQSDVIAASNPNGLPTDILIGPRYFFVTLVERPSLDAQRLPVVNRHAGKSQ